MSPTDARTQLTNLLLERADRFRVYLVAFAVVQALLLVVLAVVAHLIPTACWIGVGFWSLVALLIGGRVINVSGQITGYQQDRIVYLQAVIAAQEVSATAPSRQPRSRPPLPATVESVER